MYLMYLSEERHDSGQNVARPFRLRAQIIPHSAARPSFGLAKLQSSRLAWGDLGWQRSDLVSA